MNVACGLSDISNRSTLTQGLLGRQASMRRSGRSISHLRAARQALPGRWGRPQGLPALPVAGPRVQDSPVCQAAKRQGWAPPALAGVSSQVRPRMQVSFFRRRPLRPKPWKRTSPSCICAE